jgi:hypothetical protein
MHLSNSPTASVIDEVWAWEAVQHGDAALVNADLLGSLCKCTYPGSDPNRIDMKSAIS